jgi:hypothetical protein
MPVLADYTAEIITLRLIGEYSPDDIREAFYAALPTPDAVSGGLLIDLTQSVSIRTRPSSDVRAMSHWWAARKQIFQGRLAMVAAGTVEFGMTRLAELEADSYGLIVGVFRDAAEARAWILGYAPR